MVTMHWAWGVSKEMRVVKCDDAEKSGLGSSMDGKRRPVHWNLLDGALRMVVNELHALVRPERRWKTPSPT